MVRKRCAWGGRADGLCSLRLVSVNECLLGLCVGGGCSVGWRGVFACRVSRIAPTMVGTPWRKRESRSTKDARNDHDSEREMRSRTTATERERCDQGLQQQREREEEQGMLNGHAYDPTQSKQSRSSSKAEGDLVANLREERGGHELPSSRHVRRREAVGPRVRALAGGTRVQ
jgi:hypothetical protein